jgi:hypothetical protein
MARRKIGSGYMLRIRMDDALRQALTDAALRQDRDLSNLARTLLRDGLARLNAEATERIGLAGYPVSDAVSSHHQQHSQGRQ